MTVVLRDGSAPARHSGPMTRPLLVLAALLMAAPALGNDAGETDVPSWLRTDRPAPPPHVNFTYVLEVEATYAEGDDADETATAVIQVDATKAPGKRARVISRSDNTKDLTKIIDGVIEGLEDKDNTPERMAESFYCTLDAENFDIVHEDAERAVLKQIGRAHV